MRTRILFGLVLLGLQIVYGASPLPPVPAKFVTDSAGILSSATISQLNAKLEAFQDKTSNQVVVAIMPEVPADYAMEDFTQRTFASWGVGQKDRNNGVVLFIFPKSHKMRIEVGYGLEGALPDARAKQIIENEIKPAFKQGDFNTGVTKGVDAILASTKGEYQAPPQTGPASSSEENRGAVPSGESIDLGSVLVPLIFVLVIIISLVQALRRGTTYNSRRRSDTWFVPGTSSGGDSFFGGSSGGGSDSGGGGFSGGGGDSGGGGASGSW